MTRPPRHDRAPRATAPKRTAEAIPAPTEASLQTAALTYLSRYAATRAGVLRVLDRRIAKWAASDSGDAEGARDARQAARRVVAGLAETGAVNDAAFAQARTRTLRRAGKSSRAIGAHLAAKGVTGGTADATDAAPPDELGAAAIHIRKRRLGPFRARPETPETRKRELASLARAGFPHAVAAAALRLSRAEAETLIIGYREGVG